MVRIAVTSKVPDARAQSYLTTLRARFIRTALKRVSIAQTYTIDARLSGKEIERVAVRLTNPITESYSIRGVRAPRTYSYAIEIGFLPGVTDNVGKTARETIEDCLKKKLGEGREVYSSTFIFLGGNISHAEAERMARELHNPLIERAIIYGRSTRSFPIVVPKVKLHEAPRAAEVDINASDEELARIGKEGILNSDGSRRGPLALSLSYMKVIQKHFRKLGRNPTDVELESLAQTWSEHCKHTIFADPLDEVKEGIYRRYIKGATEKIRKQKGRGDFCVSVFKDNSGAIAFDEKYLITHKVETHNSPSALDPFGGSITAIVGVNRDCLGFGLGAKPIANVYGFCVADPSDATKYFRDKEKKEPLLSNRRILEGLVKGINAGGNQSGIPTPFGFVAVDPTYRAKPLVYGGTVGLIPRSAHGRELAEKRARPGDYIVMIGGRVGLDGIHGATFSSESLSSGSPATAVQIGDAITQKKLSDALIREARDRGLYSSITDNGAGGLSCSVAEMAKECGGCAVDLEKVPLKYPGLAPWQIWISESQERMTLAVPKKNWLALKKIFGRHGVEASVIGVFTNTERCVVSYRGKKVMDLNMKFLHDGRPVAWQRGKRVERKTREPKRGANIEKSFLSILERPGIGSTSFISQQYDHEVQGSSITKPLQGRGRVNADAAVLQPLPDTPRGIVLSSALLPSYSRLDTYAMAAASIDSAIRNAICAGATRQHLAILDNFCWSSSNTPQRLHELKEAARACYDIAVAYGTPYISGKDSMFNDFRGFTARGEKVHIAAVPTLLISTVGVVVDVSRAVTLDFKKPGDLVYVIGETNEELGASEYFALLSRDDPRSVGRIVPKVDAKKNIKRYDALEKAISNGVLASAISIGRGGLAVALARSAIGGQLGVHADLQNIPGRAKRPDSVLFSESQGRILVSVRPEGVAEFEALFKRLPYARVGEVEEGRLTLKLRGASVDVSVHTLTDAYRRFFKNW